MGIKSDVQTLSPGSIVELYELDYTSMGGEVYRFHPHRKGMPKPDESRMGSLEQDFRGNVYKTREFQPVPGLSLDFVNQKYGADNVGPIDEGQIVFQDLIYTPWPMESSGFEISSSSKQPVPSITLGNVNGFISSLVIYFNDLVGAKVTRKRTLAKYLDGAEKADPTQEMPPEVWYIECKTYESSDNVQFELSSPMNFQGQQLPRGQILANCCRWLTIGGYRGPYCGYNGPPVANEYDIITTDASKDKCGGRPRSCKMRYGELNPLPYGSFAAAGMIR